MKLKNLFAAAAVAAGLCLTGMSAVQAAPKMPESIFDHLCEIALQSAEHCDEGARDARRCLQGRRRQDQLARH